MTRSCTVCRHASRGEVDAALVAGGAYRFIAAQYGLSPSSLRRHKREHLSPQLQAAAEAECLNAARLLRDLGALQAKALTLLAKCEIQGDLRAALAGVGQVRAVIEAAAKLIETSDLETRIEALEKRIEEGETCQR